MSKNIKGYRCNQDCTLNYTNFEADEEIIIADHCEDRDWKGTDWYDSFPQIFEPIEFTQADKLIQKINEKFTDLEPEEEEKVRELLDFHASEPRAAAERIAAYLTDTLPFGITEDLVYSWL